MSGSLTADEKRQLVATRTDWFHSIDVGDGIVTPGMVPLSYLEFIFNTLQLPDDMRGMRVLDIGAYDGFFGFACEHRGADVVAVDVNPEDLHCFGLAKRLRGSRARYLQMSVYDLRADALGGTFDLVLCLGVYYHLRHLFVALDNLWQITHGEIRIETHVIDDHFILADGTVGKLADVDPRLVDTPIYRFYRYNELNPVDYSNWFGGNIAAVLDSLGSAGFTASLLGKWKSRAAFRGVKIPTLPREWEFGSYEGVQFIFQDDGSWTSTWKDPVAHGLPDRSKGIRKPGES
jgi:tRNA (mo5U34)-methyltransferase